MKKLLPIIFVTLLLVGCGDKEKYDYTGSYALLKKENACSLVVHWEYPDSDFQHTTFELDLKNFDPYIDENLTTEGSGVNLNNLLGTLGFNRSFLHASPVKISADNADKVIKKKISIYLNIKDDKGSSYRVKLKYNKSINDQG